MEEKIHVKAKQRVTFALPSMGVDGSGDIVHITLDTDPSFSFFFSQTPMREGEMLSGAHQ